MGKRKDLTGQKFNKLTVVSEAGYHVTKGGHKKRMVLCRCDCGNMTTVPAGDLKNGHVKSCGCANIDAKERRRKDLTGQRFGFLQVESLNGYKQTPNGTNCSMWNCLCDCGNRKVVRYTALVNGYTTSCGCYKKQKLSEEKTNDLVGRVFGKLTVLERFGSKKRSKSSHATWLCQCSCGNKTIADSSCLICGYTQSCGCIKMSVGEDKIKRLLMFFDVEYQTEFTFEDFRSIKGAPLRFDFALFSDKQDLLCLVEYQGIQHFKKNSYGFGDVQREETDPLKRAYCQEKGIPLVEIAYNEDVVDKICDVINRFVYHVNPVPSAG